MIVRIRDLAVLFLFFAAGIALDTVVQIILERSP